MFPRVPQGPPGAPPAKNSLFREPQNKSTGKMRGEKKLFPGPCFFNIIFGEHWPLTSAHQILCWKIKGASKTGAPYFFKIIFAVHWSKVSAQRIFSWKNKGGQKEENTTGNTRKEQRQKEGSPGTHQKRRKGHPNSKPRDPPKKTPNQRLPPKMIYPTSIWDAEFRLFSHVY